MVKLPLPESPGGFVAFGGQIPCTCGREFPTVDAFHGHTAHCDGDLDTSMEGAIRAGIRRSSD
jgi:hypothetical protein